MRQQGEKPTAVAAYQPGSRADMLAAWAGASGRRRGSGPVGGVLRFAFYE
jgi:hypothetical protein